MRYTDPRFAAVPTALPPDYRGNSTPGQSAVGSPADDSRYYISGSSKGQIGDVCKCSSSSHFALNFLK